MVVMVVIVVMMVVMMRLDFKQRHFHIHVWISQYSNLNIPIFKFEYLNIQIWISQYSNLNILRFKFEYVCIFFQYVMPWPKEITFFTDSFTRNRFHRFKFYGDLRHKHVVAILRNVRKELVVSSGASWDDEDIFQGGDVGHGIYSTLHSVWGK